MRALAPLLLTASLFAQVQPPQPTLLNASHRSGQTFLTFQERNDMAGETYRVYRHTSPITSANLPQAVRLREIPEGTSQFYSDRYRVNNQFFARWSNTFIVSELGTPLSYTTGLFVWTMGKPDFGGGSSGNAWYAVTTRDTNGLENTSTFGTENMVGPVAESIAEPLPVRTIAGNTNGQWSVYNQWMDLREWNPTFHAPNQFNGWWGENPSDPRLKLLVQHAYSYVISDPDAANCGGSLPSKLPLYLKLHWWNDSTWPPEPGATPDHCAIQIRPVDPMQTFWFGFARDYDYNVTGLPVLPDTIVNYTEYRLLRMLHDTLRDPRWGPRIDTNRIYVEGFSMGACGATALALRYPNIFAMAESRQGLTNYRTTGDQGATPWRNHVSWQWGHWLTNIPAKTLPAPNGWSDHLLKYDGKGVWDWQNHQLQLVDRIGEEMSPYACSHGVLDVLIEWLTQGAPFYAPLDASKRTWSARVEPLEHNFGASYGGLGTLGQVNGKPFRNFTVVKNEAVPGISRFSGNMPIPPIAIGNYNERYEWSASWHPWDGAPIDTSSSLGMSFRTTDTSTQTADITPRRLQAFVITPGDKFRWENRRVSDNGLVASGAVVADEHALATVKAFTMTPGGNRLRMSPDPYKLTFTPYPIGGQVTTLAIQGGRPNDSQIVIFSLTGFDSIQVPSIGTSIEINAPYLLVYGLADAQGAISWPLPLPSVLTGFKFWFQCVQIGDRTNVAPIIVR